MSSKKDTTKILFAYSEKSTESSESALDLDNEAVSDTDLTQELDSKLVFVQDRKQFYTSEASKIARQIAFTEGVIFWALYSLMPGAPRILIVTFYSMLLIVFILDLIQYIFGASRFESEEYMIKKLIASNENRNASINYKIGDEIGKSIKIFYILKLVFLSCSTIALIIIFSLFMNLEIPVPHCN